MEPQPYYYLTALLLLPLLGTILVMLVPGGRPATVRGIAAVTMLLAMVLSIVIYVKFLSLCDPARVGFQMIDRYEWFPDYKISLILGIDGLNAAMILLAGILGFAVALVSFNIQDRVQEYYALALVSITGVFGLFMSVDLFFFILFYEMASVPMYFLVQMWGTAPKTGHRRVTLDYAATKLIIYLQLAGGLALLGILGLYFAVEPHTFNLIDIMAAIKVKPLAFEVTRWLFPLMFIAFAVEGGLFPFHTWLPDGHSSAPTALSMLLAGVLLKMGSYGVIRLAIAPMPEAAQMMMPFFMGLAVINVLYGALCALKQTDIKYLIAYSSVSHMGIVFLGLGTFQASGYQGAIFQMFSHGIVTALLFALAGLVYEKTHTRNIEEMGGLAVKMPFLAATFAVAGLASLGLPGMSGFVAEVLVFLGLYSVKPLMAILAVLGLVITATYILRAVQKIFYGPLTEKFNDVCDATRLESFPLAILAFTTLLFGMWPALLIQGTTPAITSLLQSFGGIAR